MPRYRASYAGERRSASLRAWVTPIEREALELAAREAGAGLSDYVRQLCVRRIGSPAAVSGTSRNPTAKALADELRRIGLTLTELQGDDDNHAAASDRHAEWTATMAQLKTALARVIAL